MIIPYYLRLVASSYLLAVLLFMAWSAYAHAALQFGLREAEISDGSPKLGLGLLAIGLVIRAVTRLHLRRQCRNHVATASANINSGQSFVLLLYPFDTSGSPSIDVRWGHVATAWLLGRSWSIEEVLVAAVRSFLPVVALGSPEGASRAVRLTIADEEWPTVVEDLARRAAAIVFLPGSGKGLSWEFNLLVSDKSLALKTIFVRVSSPLGLVGRICLAIARVRGLKPEPELAFGHTLPLSREMWLMLIDGIYFLDRGATEKWEYFYLPLLGGHPQHLLSLVLASSWSRHSGFRLRLFSEAQMHPMPFNEQNQDAIADRAVQDIRNTASWVYEIPRGIEAAFLASVVATWWPLL